MVLILCEKYIRKCCCHCNNDMSQSSSGAHQSSLSKASAGSFSTMPMVDLSREEDDEIYRFIAPPHWLPSSSYKYSHWHDIEDHSIMGSQLHSPRIREFPKEPTTSGLDDVPTGITPRCQRTKDYCNQLENWENVECVNLSYQALGDPYQLKNFERVLMRLVRCRQLQLMDNSLSDLSKICLPTCTMLYLNRNCFQSFKKLPKCPNLQYLNLTENSISKVKGLSHLRKYPLKSLVLTRNPVEYIANFRHKVFSELPELELLDGYPRLTEDMKSQSSSSSDSTEQQHSKLNSEYCIIS